MRLVIEIVIILGLVLIFWADEQSDSTKIAKSKERVESLEERGETYRDSIASLRSHADSLNEKTDKLENRLSKTQDRIDHIKNVYTDSIQAIEKAQLTDLVDSSRIIVKGDTTFVLVSEEFYRTSLSNRTRLKKLRSLVGIYRDRVALQDSIIELKNESIMNLMERTAVQRHRINLKDTIISEKDIQLDGKDQVIKKIKRQRNLVIGGAAGVILLILL
jgi:chromosome segregation ATPase